MIDGILVNTLAFLVSIVLLVGLHELGHFWVARRLGVKVLSFSIGFGPTLYKRTGKVDGTEFMLGSIPLGGYVKMLDERVAPVAPEELGRSFNRQSLRARSAVVLAGPLVNFAVALVAYWIVLVIGIAGAAPLLGAPAPGSAAARAGFIDEDLVVSIDDEPILTWAEMRLELLRASLRDTESLDVGVRTSEGALATRALALEGVDSPHADPATMLGLGTWWPSIEPRLSEVTPGGAADRAGLEPGDIVTSIDGVPILDMLELVSRVRTGAGDPLELGIVRAGSALVLDVVPDALETPEGPVGRIGVKAATPEGASERLHVEVRLSPLDALPAAAMRTRDMSLLTLRAFGNLLTGQMSIDNISGPISIAKVAGDTASIGIAHYLSFLALISISLAVLNLLPVPTLDGGHLLYFAIEAVRGKPMSERLQLLGHQVGLALILGFACLALYSDIGKLGT